MLMLDQNSSRSLWGHKARHGLIVSLIASAAMFTFPVATLAAPVDQLIKALRFQEVVDVLADEGRSMSTDMADAGFGVPKPSWDLMLGQLYDTPSMQDAFRTSLNEALSSADVGPMLAFFESELGSKLTDLELEARKIVSDEAVLEAAVDMWSEMPADDARAEQIDAYVDVNDLVEMNIVSSLNSDIAYMRGLMSGAQSDLALSDTDILRDVWASEPEVRVQVSEWIYGYSVLAYETLSDDEFAAYITFGETAAGQALNAALFFAFDEVYAELSFGLGAGTAQLMQSLADTAL
jgi:hypothetical protein